MAKDTIVMTSPVGRIHYGAILEKSAYQEGAPEEHLIQLFFDMSNAKTAEAVSKMEAMLLDIYAEQTGESEMSNPVVRDGDEYHEYKIKKLKKELKKEGKTGAEAEEAIASAEEGLAHLKGTKWIKVKSRFDIDLGQRNKETGSIIILDKEDPELSELFYRGAKCSVTFTAKAYDVDDNTGMSLYFFTRRDHAEPSITFLAHGHRLAGGDGGGESASFADYSDLEDDFDETDAVL